MGSNCLQITCNVFFEYSQHVQQYVLALIALLSLIANIIIAIKTTKLNKKMLHSQNLIDLHREWKEVNDIDTSDLVGPDVRKAVNAMSLTATHWLEGTIKKEVVYQQYSDAYKTLYTKLSGIDDFVPGYDKRCKELITEEISEVYIIMKRYKNKRCNK